MNLTTAIMLVNKGIRPVKVEYDPDVARNNNPHKFFKTLDRDIKKDDLVIVPTQTRHGFTMAKVTDIDFPVDYNDPTPWGWIGGKFDKATYDEVLKIEDNVKHLVAKTQENKMRQELIDAAGLGEVDFSSVMSAIAPPAVAKAGVIQAAPQEIHDGGDVLYPTERPERPPYNPKASSGSLSEDPF